MFGDLEVATGKILAPMLHPTRTEADFLRNIQNVIALDPQGDWRFITDNLNTHASESLVQYVAEQCEIDADLGAKGRRGVLRSMATPFNTASNFRH